RDPVGPALDAPRGGSLRERSRRSIISSHRVKSQPTRRRPPPARTGGERSPVMSIQSINPATHEPLETFPQTSRAQTARIRASGHATFLEWRTRPFTERAACMREAARLLRARRAELARTMTLEMGKPITQGEAEADKCAWVCDYYAEHAEAFLAVDPRNTDGS